MKITFDGQIFLFECLNMNWKIKQNVIATHHKIKCFRLSRRRIVRMLSVSLLLRPSRWAFNSLKSSCRDISPGISRYAQNVIQLEIWRMWFKVNWCSCNEFHRLQLKVETCFNFIFEFGNSKLLFIEHADVGRNFRWSNRSGIDLNIFLKATKRVTINYEVETENEKKILF